MPDGISDEGYLSERAHLTEQINTFRQPYDCHQRLKLNCRVKLSPYLITTVQCAWSRHSCLVLLEDCDTECRVKSGAAEVSYIIIDQLYHYLIIEGACRFSRLREI